MSTARLGGKAWADVDEDDEEEEANVGDKSKGTRFESAVDEDGVKTVIEYTERDQKTYKITRKVRVKKVITHSTKAMLERKDMENFGKAAANDPMSEKQLCVRSEEEFHIELSKKLATQVNVQEEAIEKFFEESVTMNATLNKEKKAWTTKNAEKREEEAGGGAPAADAAASAMAAAKPLESIGGAGRPGATSTYVPPSLRGGGDGKGGKGGGKDSFAAQQEASLRVTNLSEDCKEGDLHDLFGTVGRLQRVYLAKDQVTGVSRGFAFVTYCNRSDAEKAIVKLDKKGYDNLILQVQFAKPKQ